MADIIVILILVCCVGGACRYLWKAKKSGRKCIGCPSGGSCGCECESRQNNNLEK